MATQNCIVVLEYLKQNYGKECERREMVKTLSIPMIAVIGVMTPLINKNYATKREENVVDLDTGKTIKNTYYSLTEEGLSYDPSEN